MSAGPVQEMLRDGGRELAAFVRMLVGGGDRAEDLYQETCLEIWRSRERFESGADFGRWARGVARNVVLRACRSRGGAPTTPFGPEVVEQLAEAWEERLDGPTEREVALRACLDELSAPHQQLMDLAYREERSHAEVAASTGRTTGSVKVLLHRIRKKLMDCVNRRLREGDGR